MVSRGFIYLVALVGVLTIMSFSQKAYAHVLVSDESNTVGAVLHITPDDDPIAGESAHIFFDVQDKKFSSGTYGAILTVVGTDGVEKTIQTKKEGSYVSARYTFATRGVYTLKLSVTHGGDSTNFSVTQRVARGVMGEEDHAGYMRHQWAEILVVASLAGAGVFMVLFLVRFREIARQSQ